MLRNRRLFKKNNFYFRIHMEEEEARKKLASQMKEQLLDRNSTENVIVCIGTDRSTGDAFGPIIGSNLQKARLSHFQVYGTLDTPVHAVNLNEKLEEIYATYQNPFIIAIDACLGRAANVGNLTFAEGPVKPGLAVKKDLPPVGEMHITGIVNVGGMMEYFVLQNTRLHFVMSMADVVTESIKLTDRQLTKKELEKEQSRFGWFKLP